jgi:hypothetical protein
MSTALAAEMAALGIALEPCLPGEGPVVTLPQVAGWSQVHTSLLPAAHSAWALDSRNYGGWCPNAVLLVGRASAEIDFADLAGAAVDEARELPEWRESRAAVANYGGFQGLRIEGSYQAGGLALWAATRYVLAHAGSGQYLIQLTVTVRDDERPALEEDVAAWIFGLSIR